LALINAQYTSELMRMKRSSDESLKAKTGFLANLSHEIRAPLGVMMNAVELVLDGICGTVSPDQAETLKMVHSNGEHLLELINDVLDYAKVESGKLFPQKVDINVNDLLRDVSNVVRTQAEAKSHKLICRVDNDVVAISCDRRHARQMLINLLSNAIKYTPDGGVIEVFLERMPGKKVKLHVRDSGVGIDTADRSKVFAAFERLENSYSRNQVGTGLGMSLTKRLAEVNGASIDFASVPGKGSDFWLLFETVEVSSAIVQEVQDQPVISRGKDELVLIVEREDGERAMLNRYLTHNGYKTLLAANSMEAIELFRGKKIDLAVIDNNMADGTNDDLIRAIRNLPTGSHVPIVLLTSRAFVFDIEKYLKSGIDRCLIKPVKLGDLGITCRQLIDGTFEGEVIDSTEREIVVQDKKEEKKNLKYNTRVITAEERQ
jgi:CheY-like chemotaxis protein/nitrogen-specific signal transduction histidine kinase